MRSLGSKLLSSALAAAVWGPFILALWGLQSATRSEPVFCSSAEVYTTASSTPARSVAACPSAAVDHPRGHGGETSWMLGITR